MFSNKGHNKQRLLKAFMGNDYIMSTIDHSKWQLNWIKQLKSEVSFPAIVSTHEDLEFLGIKRTF